jgi:hypothetical protein
VKEGGQKSPGTPMKKEELLKQGELELPNV